MPIFSQSRAVSAKFAAFLLAAGASLSLAGSASAQVFKVTANGTVSHVYDDHGLFDSSVAVGTPYTFSFLFDYSIPLDLHNDEPFPTFRDYSGYFGATTTLGDYTFTPFPSALNSIDIIPQTSELFLGSIDEKTTGFTVPVGNAATSIFIGDYTYLTGEMPALSAYNDADLASTSFSAYVNDFNGNSASVFGTLTSLSAELVPVPEASTTVSLGVLLGLGGIMLAVRRRRVTGR